MSQFNHLHHPPPIASIGTLSSCYLLFELRLVAAPGSAGHLLTGAFLLGGPFDLKHNCNVEVNLDTVVDYYQEEHKLRGMDVEVIGNCVHTGCIGKIVSRFIVAGAAAGAAATFPLVLVEMTSGSTYPINTYNLRRCSPEIS